MMNRQYLASLSLFMGCCLASAQRCSVEYNTTCNSMGNATLDTAAYYEKYKKCHWSFRDKNDTNHDNLTPGFNISVQCFTEIRVKVDCTTPKVEFLACYKIVNETNRESREQSSSEASHHRVHEMVLIPVGLFLVMLLVLIIYYFAQWCSYNYFVHADYSI